MTATKSTLNVKIDKGVKSSLTIDEQIRAMALKRSPKVVHLQTDANGSVIIDKDSHPDIYDWAVNG